MATDTRFAMRDGTAMDWPAVRRRWRRDFPPDERIDPRRLDALWRRGAVRLAVAIHRLSGALAGYALWIAPAAPVVWLDYLAMGSRWRGQGGGTALWRFVVQRRPDALAALWEVEPVDDPDPVGRQGQMARRRFYERLGGRVVLSTYRFPTPTGGRPLELWAWVRPGITEVPAATIRAVLAEVFQLRHGEDPVAMAILAAVGPILDGMAGPPGVTGDATRSPLG